MSMGGDVYLWRQTFVIAAGFFHTMGTNIMITFTSVLTPAILAPNATDIRATSDEASWIAASMGISGMIGYLVNPIIMDTYGRRVNYMILNIFLIIGWITFVFAKNVTTLFIARLIQGVAGGGLFVNALLISEYSHPTRRGYFSSIKKLFGALGSLLCHGLTLIWSWRSIAAVSIIPCCISLIITIFSPETPSFLAYKGRFEECEKSFVWLHGTSKRSERELKELLIAQREKREMDHQKSLCNKLSDKTLWIAFTKVALLTVILDACGRFYFLAYTIQMMTEVTGDVSVAIYCILGADCLAMIGLLFSLFVLKTYKRRTVLYTFGLLTVLLMFSIGIIKLLNFKYVVWLLTIVILLQYFIINLTLIPVTFVLFGEIFPLEFRGIGSCLAGMVFIIFFMVTMKLTPILMQYTGVGGTYSTYGACVLICLIILYFVLEETKDKTLQQIEDEACGVVRELDDMKPMLVVNKVS